MIAKTLICGTLALAVSGIARPALADALILGGGSTDYKLSDARNAPALQLEWHDAPSVSPGGLDMSLGVAAAHHADGGDWLGVGVSTLHEFGVGWFVEGSLMPGYYFAGSDTIAESGVSLRALAGVGREIGGGYGLSLAVSRNFGAADGGEGVNALTLRVRKSY